MSRGIRDFGIIGPTGPKGPTYCPYCHAPYEKMPISVKATDYDDAKWWACYTNKLGYVQRIIYMQRECDFEPWTILVENNPKFCEMCGQPLNEEEDYEQK